jgi:hypothetical protein
MLYDNLDGLKIGLDTTLLRFSRASLNYYQKHGLVTRDETEADAFNDDEGVTSEDIALLSHHISMLEHNLLMMEEGRTLVVANHLIASCTDHLVKVLTLSVGDGMTLGVDDEYKKYLSNAYGMSQDDVDRCTIAYLQSAIGVLGGTVGIPAKELAVAESALEEFQKLRGDGTGKVPQELADHLFVYVFQELVSLMKAYRHLLIHRRSAAAVGDQIVS